jgi:hypothetical protein
MWQRDILRERRYGITRCASARVFDRGLKDVLALFGLMPREEALIEVSAERAGAILAALLWKDLAYNYEVMPEARARELADAFVRDQPAPTRFFANADWAAVLRERPKAFPFTGLTFSTFDGGVIALGGGFASCVWVEDED